MSYQIQQLAIKWLDAFNAKDLEKLLSLYDEDAEHYSPKLKISQPESNGTIKGKMALKSWWQDAFDKLPSLHYKVTSLTSNENRVFMEYIRQVDGEEELLIAEVLEIRDNLIVFSRVYHG